MTIVSSFVYRIRKSFYEFRWFFKSAAWLFVEKARPAALTNTAYAVGIVTYVDRYETFFKPLFTSLAHCFPDTEIIVAVNGYHDQQVQDSYLARIIPYLSAWPNARTVTYREPQSLSKLWNQLIRHSSVPKVLILNDDIKIDPFFRKDLEHSGALEQDIALINRSWSHFIISKQMTGRAGWFDQRFPAVGNEDEDYESRLAFAEIPLRSYPVRSLKNIIFKTTNFSYGKNTETVNSKYAKANKIYFDKKWELSDIPAEGYKYVEILGLYVKPKEGMETPDFYGSADEQSQALLV